MQVRDVMSVRVVALSPGSALGEAAVALRERGIGGAPVVEGGRIVGMLTGSDLIRARPAAATVRDAMSSGHLLALSEAMELSEAIRAMSSRGVERAPVVRDGRLVGMVTRSDLLRSYLRTDSEIRAEVEMEVLVRTLGLSPRTVSVRVEGGVVHLSGSVSSTATRELLGRLVGAVHGVVGVDDHSLVVADGERVGGTR